MVVNNLPQLNRIREETIFAYLASKKKMLDAVCITGGEPTLQPDLVEFIVKIKKLGYLVKLDTNGSNSIVLKELLDRKLLDYIAMDLKSPFERYSAIRIFGYSDIIKFGNYKINEISKIVDACRKSFRLIQDSGVDHEFRTTVFPQKHTENDFLEMAKYLRKGEKYYLQNIQYYKNLDPNLDQSKKIDIGLLLNKLKKKYSDLVIEQR